MHTLIVDDVLILRKMLITLLKKHGTFDVAENGDVAINMFEKSLKTNPYDLICMDIIMPVTDGIKAIQMIRLLEEEHNIHPSNRVKIIMITTMNDEDTVKQCATYGCDGYLVKPFSSKNLYEMLEKLNLMTLENS